MWDIVNTTGVEHPFHLHTWPFQVLRRGHVTEPFPAWRDIAVVQVDKERVDYWIKKGAQPSDSVRTLMARHLTPAPATAVPAPVAVEAK